MLKIKEEFQEKNTVCAYLYYPRCLEQQNFSETEREI